MKTKEQVLDKLRTAKDDLRVRFPITELALFGSFSKGLNGPDSDIDILFHPKDDAVFGLKETVELSEYFRELFSLDKVDIVNKKYINPIVELDIEDSLIYV